MKQFLFAFLLCIPASLYALDVVQNTVPASTATGLGSVGNTVRVFANQLSYINAGNDSTVIGNFLSGSYYDDAYGSFITNWSSNPSLNVRIVGTTTRCQSGYGYQLGGYAKSDVGGFIDFDTSATNFVYYCEATGQLYGFAYSNTLGWQNFSGIQLSTASSSNIVTNLNRTNDPFFVTTSSTANQSPSNPTDPFAIQGDIQSLDNGKESTFYIVK